MMKTRNLLLITLFASAFGCQRSFENASTKIVIDRFASKEDLAKMIEGLKSVNINMKFADAIYSHNGRLMKIKGSVEFGDHSYGTFTSENVGKIIITKDLMSNDGGFSILVKNRWL